MCLLAHQSQKGGGPSDAIKRVEPPMKWLKSIRLMKSLYLLFPPPPPLHEMSNFIDFMKSQIRDIHPSWNDKIHEIKDLSVHPTGNVRNRDIDELAEHSPSISTPTR